MWSWNPTTSTSFPGYPHMQHLPGHTQFSAPRLGAGYQNSPPAGYYPHIPNVGYSGGPRLVTPQTLPLSAHWQGSHVRTPEEGIQYVQQQPEVLQSPGNHHLHESHLQNSFSPQEESFQRNLYSQQQQVFQVSPGSQAGLGNFPGGAPAPMHSYHQQALPSEAHTPAFQSSPPTLATGFQTAANSQQFPKAVTPTTTTPYQSLEPHPPELGRPQIESPANELLPREELGYTSPHVQSNPFSMDYLLRDRPAVDREFNTEHTQTSAGYNSFVPRPQSDHMTPHSDHMTPHSDHMTPQSDHVTPRSDQMTPQSPQILQFEATPNEGQFSPPELVPMSTAGNNSEEPRDSHKNSTRSSMEEDKGLSIAAKSKPGVFQLAVTEAEPTMSDHNDEQNKESLIRHQRNRGYESSDDDEVFLPDTGAKLAPQEGTEGEPQAQTTEACEKEIKSQEQASKPQEPVVIKRGRGTAKTLNMDKLQLPLSQGWRRLVRKRVGPDQVRVDISYIAPWPNGKKLRTFPEIQSQLDLTDSKLTIENFTFSRKVDLGEVLDWGPVSENSRRGKRGRGRGRGSHDQGPDRTSEGIPPTTTPPKTRGRGRGRGRGGRPRKTVESAPIHGEQWPITTTSNAITENINTIGAISGDTAKALIQKAINETDINNSAFNTRVELTTPTGSAEAPAQVEEKPPVQNEPSQSSSTHTSLEFHMHTPSTLQGSGRPGRGRKRKSITTTEHAQKRARGRPKGSRRSLTQAPQRPLLPAEGQPGLDSSQTAKIQEEKRRQLLLKARVDKARKKEGRGYQRSLSMSQRKLAQRQRRERERKLMKQARERQDKLTKQREAEDREMRKQSVAKQREVDNQRRARERTMRLLAHLKQQELERNRRLYIQQLEMEKMAQLKRPIEDLEVRDSSSLPPLSPMSWVQLPAQAFADLLMLCEFGRSFSEFLEVEGEFPTLSSVYLSLYNHKQGRVAVKLLSQLLKAVLHDPGTRVCTESGTLLGHVEVTPLTISEVLRLFLASSDSISPQLAQVIVALRSAPVQSLRPSEKVLVFAHLVNMLLDSVSLMREVDTRMEQLATLRREKWKISLKMKRFRSRLSAVYGIGSKTKPVAYSGRGRPPKRALIGGLPGNGEESSDEGEVPDEEHIPVASDGEYSEEPSDEETPEGKDELQSRLKSLKKKFISVRKRIYASSRMMRKFPLGQDRYARQYWVLPSVGGVIIEGVETSLDKNLQVVDTALVKEENSQSDSSVVKDEQTSELEVVKEENDHSEKMEIDQSNERLESQPPTEAKVSETSNERTENESESENSSGVVNDATGCEAKPSSPSYRATESPSNQENKTEVLCENDPIDTEAAGNEGPELPSEPTGNQYKDEENGRLSSPPSETGSISSPHKPELAVEQNALVSHPASHHEESGLVASTSPFEQISEKDHVIQEESHLTCSESLAGEESKDSSPPTQSWFSLSQRVPCEIVEAAYQSPAQQFVVAGATPQYAYMTADGQIVTAAGLSQMGYSIVGNTLVQTQQPQYIAVNSNTSLVVGGQPAAVQYAVGEGGSGVQYLAVGSGGYIAVGAGQQVLMQDNGQMVVVQNGQALVSAPAQSQVKQESEQPESDEEIKQEEQKEETPPPAPPVNEPEPSNSPETQSQSTDQYVTAVVPGGPDGAPQYVSLPADPRVMSGHCSYAVLQQPDGTQQIVLVENTSINNTSGTSYQGDDGSPVMIETPPHRLMDNETEGESFVTSITLMYAQEPVQQYIPETRPSPPRGDEKQLRELLEEQDIDLTHGWWSVTQGEVIERLLRTLCSRGVREKCLLKYLQKNKDTVTNILDPEILKSFQRLFREHSNPEIVKKPEDVEMSDSNTEETEMETDDSANVSASQSQQTTNEISSEESHDRNNPNFPGFCQEILSSAVDYLVDMQQRLVTAQLTEKEVELWEGLRDHVTALGHTHEGISLIGKHLLELEECISRFYLKPPLRSKKLYQEDQESSSRSRRDRSLAVRRENTALELPCPGLLSWRQAVSMCSSTSQLCVCMSELEACIAWEKSNTIVFCQVCHSGENESLLLLCDRCDKGTHTYCCKPKLSIVPEGDWYCYSCVTSNGKYRPCYTCDSKRGVLLSCAVCPRNYHKRCLNPPLSKMPGNLWKCPNCKHKPIPHARLKDSRKKDKNSAKNNDELCHTLLEELRSHDQAWPFLEPVERKKFPGYFKVIKKPMDLLTIENNLEEGKYCEDLELFAADVRLIFSNCLYYNEDQSEIGKAGHNMSDFFEEKWSKIN